MRKMQKFLAMLLVMVMVLATGITVMAEEETTGAIVGPDDTAVVKIRDLSGEPSVTLYQIAKANYETKAWVTYDWVVNTEFDDVSAPTAGEITEIANGLVRGTITAWDVIEPDKLAEGITEYVKEVNAGAYIAIITGASDSSIYNPILLTATYDEVGDLIGGEVSAEDSYLYGTTAVAKKSQPSIDKTVEGTTPDASDEENKGIIGTGSVGDVLTYTITPKMPIYPKEATNKTFYLTDNMTAGLTFIYDSLTITIDEAVVTRDGNNFYIGEGENKALLATATKEENGFTLWFDYDKLIMNEITGAVHTPIVTYQAVINENAVVGNDYNETGNEGNINYAELYYSNQPNKGVTWTPDSGIDIDDAEGVTKHEDSEVVYTYQLSFVKTDADEDTPVPLAGAVFGIYEDAACTKLIDIVTTNENGYAVSTNVRYGTYYIREIAAPEGYSLNLDVYEITASWVTATIKDTETVTDCTYTIDPEESIDGIQVGWIKDGVFYAMNEFEEEVEDEVYKAYIETMSTTTTTSETHLENQEAGSGTVSLGAAIPNTKLVDLPSTGGIGTVIFTVGGCAIMLAAAFLFFLNRRRESIEE